MMNALKLFPVLLILNLFSVNGNAQVVDSSKMSLGWVDFGGGRVALGGNQYSSGFNISVSYSHYLPKFCYQIGYDGGIDLLATDLISNIHFDLGKRYFD